MKKNLLNINLIIAITCFCSLIINAQTPRLQLFEYFDNCQLTAGAAVDKYINGLENANTGNMISINYHADIITKPIDSMNIVNPTQVEYRLNYYNLFILPWGYQDGGDTISNNLFYGIPDTLTQSRIDARAAMLSPLSISVSHSLNATHDSLQTHTVIRKTGTTSSTLAVEVAVIERTIHFAIPPGLSGDVNFENVMKEMLPTTSINGTVVPSMNIGDSMVLDLSWKLANVYDTSQLAVVSFVQDYSNREVIQAGYSPPFPKMNDAGILSVNVGVTPFNGVTLFSCDSISPNVVLHNGGSNILTSCTINSQIDNGAPSTFPWSGSLAPDSSVDVMLPSFFSGGYHSLKVFSSNPNGSSDPEHYNDTTFTYFSEAPVPAPAPLIQGFEGAFPPPNWSIIGPNSNETWQQYAVGGFGTSGKSARLHFFNIPAGEINDFYAPTLDLSSNVDSVKCTFSVAYARFDNVNFDSLKVRVSTDCGASWTTVYSKGSTVLATAPDDNSLSVSFVPTAAQWRHENINLTSFIGQQDVLLQFRGISGYGNNLYIDDINISGPVGIESYNIPNRLNVYPNPSTGNFLIVSAHSINKGILEVYNALGERILEESVNFTSKMEVNLQNTPSGFYFMKINDGENTITKKIVVQRD